MPAQPPPAKSSTSSRFVFGCLTLFGLPFVAGGLLALVQGIRQYGKSRDAFGPIIAGSVFTLVGLLIMVGAAYAALTAGKTDALKSQNPDKPWMWREDWMRGVIKDSNKGQAIGFWIFALLWNSIAFPFAFLAIPQISKQNLAPLVVFIFPFIGVFLVIGAIYRTARSMKFGTSLCRLDRVPIAPGRSCSGAIELNTDATPQNGYRIRIASVRATTTRTGKNRSTTERVLWDEEIAVSPSAAMRSPAGARVPFKFVTPPDAHPTDESDTYDRYLWRLSATAEFPGVDYAAQFDIPVFQTGESADPAEFADFQQRHRAEAARQPVEQIPGVEITKLPTGGEQFRIRAKKTFGGIVGSLIFLMLWNAGVAAMIHFGVNWIGTGVVILFDLLFILATIDYLVGLTTVTVDGSGVQIRRAWLGAGMTRSYESAAIASIDGVTAGQANNSFGVQMKLTDGKTKVLGSYFSDRTSADVIAAKMMADLGRV